MVVLKDIILLGVHQFWYWWKWWRHWNGGAGGDQGIAGVQYSGSGGGGGLPFTRKQTEVVLVEMVLWLSDMQFID